MVGSPAKSTRRLSHDPAMTDKEKARKARKRDTDRQSQRHHRERQRAYIRELEEMVESFKQSCAQGSNPDLGALIADNEELRGRCNMLESTLARIRSLAGDVGRRSPLCDVTSLPSTQIHGLDKDSWLSMPPQESLTSRVTDTNETPKPVARAKNNLSRGAELQIPEEESNEPIQHVKIGQNRPLEDCPASPKISVNLIEPDVPSPPGLQQQDTDLFPALGVNTSENDEDLGIRPLPRQVKSYADVASHDYAKTFEPRAIELDDAQLSDLDMTAGLDHFIDSILDGTEMSCDLVPMSQTTRTPDFAQRAATQHRPSSLSDPQTLSIGGSPEYLAFPITIARCDWDSILFDMINEAKIQHAAGLYPIDQPSLQSVLSSTSSDVLAYRLYHHICAHGPMPLHNFLSIFWVQYLVLRWYVLGTATAYLQIPNFMRPTELERRIPHSISIGMLVWPDVRRTLIRDSSTTSVQATGTALLGHLANDWSSTHYAGDCTIGTTDVLSLIEGQACTLDAWKISREFTNLNPQFAHCQLLHYD